MWIWIAAQIAVVAAVVVSVAVRRRRKAYDVIPGHQAPPLIEPEDARVTWPRDGMSPPVSAMHLVDGLNFHVELPDEEAALAFLRGCEIRQERVFVRVDHPKGTLVKDLIAITDDADHGAIVELAQRSARTRLTREDCGRCGYPVLRNGSGGRIEPGEATWRITIDSLARLGRGFRCVSCGALACAWCFKGTEPERDADGSPIPRCWICRAEVVVHADPRSEAWYGV